MLKKFSLICCFFAFITTSTVQSHPVNGTMIDGGGGGEDVLDGEFGVYVAACAAFATASLAKWVKDIVSEKDFARNLGLKVSDFWFGMVDGCQRPNSINQMLSDQMTVDMRRILQEAMAYGLKKQPYDNNKSQKFTPGYFGPDNQYFAWQNLFPSTLNKDLMAPGLVIYFPADKDDFINVAEFVKNTDRPTNARHHHVIQQLLENLLPPEKKRKPLLGQSLDGLTRVFKSGVLRPASYYGYDLESQELKPVTNGVQVMRIVNPADREGDMVDLLGTLVYIPDLNQRQGVNIDITSPLLLKPGDMNHTDWLYTLPNRLRWFLSKKDRFFQAGSRRLDLQKFSGPLTYKHLKAREKEGSDSEEKRQLELERQERQALEQQLYALEARKDEELVKVYEENKKRLERLSQLLAEKDALERARQFDLETGGARFAYQPRPSRIPVRKARVLARRDSSPELSAHRASASLSSPPLRRTRSSVGLGSADVVSLGRRRSSPPTMAAAEERIVCAQSVPIARSPSLEAVGAAAFSVSPPRAARGRFTLVEGIGSDASAAGEDEVYAYESAPWVAAHRPEPMEECKALLQREIDEANLRAESCRRRSCEAQVQLESQHELTARKMAALSEGEGSSSSRPSSPAYSDCSIDEDSLTSVMVV
ncbi:MAG: hypothetical protein CMM87_04050 [Rickettsiales bacterium]|nr:hypothetical protein [Rickettsiales bacterium]|tara:strand:+ start:41803 stop:43752 length:1950 start_codon:yes stop_codon:yes gene_type:complete